MLYAPSQGPTQDIIHARVATNGYGPYYQRAAWNAIAPLPMPACAHDWDAIWSLLDERYPKMSQSTLG